ncbi:MAG: hypothetical protein ACRDLO_02535 [Solirubrobacterales bacterium]
MRGNEGDVVRRSQERNELRDALFKDLPRRLALELVDARTYSTGAAVHVYHPR